MRGPPVVPKEVHTIVDMTKRKKETQSRHEFMCNYTLIDGFFLRPSFWDEPLHFFHGALPKACTWVAVPLKYFQVKKYNFLILKQFLEN